MVDNNEIYKLRAYLA